MRWEVRGVKSDKTDKIKHFTDLKVWQKAHELELLLYSLTKKFPKEELFGITSQIRRAVTSITANIAEGMGRNSYSDRCRFYFNARGSVFEVESFAITSKDLGYIIVEDFNRSSCLIESTRQLLNAFISSTQRLAHD